MRSLRLLPLAAAVLLAAPAVHAAKVKVPVDLGLGPAGYHFFGAVGDDQPVHYGLKISLEAVIDKELIKRNRSKIPASYRAMAGSMEEVRFSPSIFIPDALIISPKLEQTGIYGVTWRPVGLNVPLIKSGVRLTVGAALLLTYAFLYSDTLPTTHFVRPGLDLGAELEIPITKSFLVSLGWSSGLYVPQKLGELGMGTLPDELDQTIWHAGQGFLQLHFRFPYETKI